MAGDLRYTDFRIPYELIYSVDEPRLDFPEKHMLCRYILKNLPEIIVEDRGGWMLYFGRNTDTKNYFDSEWQVFRGRQIILEDN